MMKIPVAFSTLCLFFAGCGGETVANDVAEVLDIVEVAEVPISFTIMTFNTGTTDNLDHGADPDGYTNAFAALSAEYFGNNLSWLPARAGLRLIVDTLKPDIIAFQELFYDPECVEICQELQAIDVDLGAAACGDGGSFVCAVWAEGAELTVRAAVGPDYSIACAPDHEDNCIAVRKGFGSIANCDDGPCIGGLDGMKPPNDCNSGARVATGLVTVTNGPQIAVVDVHTVVGPDNLDCRVAQLKQVFEDRGDGKPATFGPHNIVLGDMNIDPFLMSDASVTYWNLMVGEGKPFHYISSDAQEGPNTHPYSFMKLDHVISDNMTGSCVVLGVSEGTTAPISEGSTYFDHRPVFCTVEMPVD